MRAEALLDNKDLRRELTRIFRELEAFICLPRRFGKSYWGGPKGSF